MLDGLSGSWFVVMNHALLQGWQWGIDLVFTGGPLAFLFTGAYHPQLWPWALLFWGLVALLLTWALLELTADLGLVVRGALLLGEGLLMAVQTPGNIVFLSLPLLAVFSLKRPTLEVRPLTVALVLASAVASLAKVSALPLAFATFLLVDLWRLAHRRPPILLPLWMLSVVVGFVAAGQEVTHLGSFLRGAGEMISGYSEAMAEAGPAWEVCAVALGLAALVVVQGWALVERRKDRAVVFVEALRWLALAGWALLVFKSSVVRQGHILTGWGCLALMALPIANVSQGLKRRRVALCLVLSVFLGAAFCLGQAVAERPAPAGGPLGILRDYRSLVRLIVTPQRELGRHVRRFETTIEELRSDAKLPPIQGSVDMLPADAAPLVAHQYDYRPRPSFQDYATYTPGLARLNRDFYLGERAPDRLLLSDLRTLDGRLPALSEAGLWPTLLSRYAIEGRRGRWLLLRRGETPRAVQRLPLRKFDARAGEPIAVPAEDAVWATIRIRRTLLGRLARFAYRLEPPQILLRLADDSRLEHRWVPGMSEDGFLLQPYVRNVDHVQLLWQGRLESLPQEAREDLAKRRVVEATIQLDTFQRWLYDDRLEVEFERLEIPPVPPRP